MVISVIEKILEGEKEVIWFESLTFLNKDDHNFYVPLKLCYDHLGREDLKIGFLICSLFF